MSPSTSRQPFTIQLVKTRQEIEEAHRIRIQVFTVEQGFPIEVEIDEIDSGCTHWLLFPTEHAPATATGNAVGTIRLVPAELKKHDDHASGLGRLCLLPEYRGKGLGKAFVDTLHEYARSIGVKRLHLHSQMDKIQFYEHCGYKIDDPTPIVWDGADHMSMSRDL
eukprot:jgi/Hompol1/2472/HPOL_000091-RA